MASDRRRRPIVTTTIQPNNRTLYSVINIRNGKIVQIQDVRSRRQAERLAAVQPH
jgi:hypothetical protein